MTVTYNKEVQTCTPENKMVIDIDGPAGNVFWLIDIANKLGKRLGFNTGEIVSEMVNADYANALQVFNNHFSEYVVLETKYENGIGVQQKGKGVSQ